MSRIFCAIKLIAFEPPMRMMRKAMRRAMNEASVVTDLQNFEPP